MANLIFTPWYYVHQQATVGRYTLHPFDLSIRHPNLGQVENEAREILRSYLKQPFTSAQFNPPLREKPVTHATLILQNGGTLNPREIEVLQYVIAFAGISAREFTNDDRYLCTENFKIVIQSYPTPIVTPFDPLITTKTKIGSSNNVFSANLFREVKPWHIKNQRVQGNPANRLVFDEPLAQALWQFAKSRARMQKFWKLNAFPSLFSFYHANTDGSSDQSELVYSHAALERLLLGGGHKEQNFVERALELLQNNHIIFEPFHGTARAWQTITYEDNAGTQVASASIFEAWLRELTRLRNQFAHGNADQAGPSVWSLAEHLLLASFVFPLLLKLRITRFDPAVTFLIAADDVKKLRMFEYMLATTNYMNDTAPNSGITNWGQLISDAHWLK